jgi:uncharacterized protein YjbI with pentapeptide repeats
MQTKSTLDEHLAGLLKKHEKWLSAELTDAQGQLNWAKLEPIFAGYLSLGAAYASGPDLSGCNLQAADLSGARLSNARFQKANLSTASLMDADLSGADLRKADLSDAECMDANFSKTNFSDAKLSDVDFTLCRLRNACLVRVEAEKADFSETDMVDTNLKYIMANDSDFREANLKGADFSFASLISANLSDAILVNANLTKVDLNAATLIQTDLSNTILTGAKLYGTARDGWRVKDVNCDYVYWDKHAREKFPPNRSYDRIKHEFEKQHADYATFRIHFEHGMTPIDLDLLGRIEKNLKNLRPDLGIRVDQATVRGLCPAVQFIVSRESVAIEAQKVVENMYALRVSQLEIGLIELKNSQRANEEGKLLVPLATTAITKVNSQIQAIEEISRVQMSLIEHALQLGVGAQARSFAQKDPSECDDVRKGVAIVAKALSDGTLCDRKGQISKALDVITTKLKGEEHQEGKLKEAWYILATTIAAIPGAHFVGKLLIALFK